MPEAFLSSALQVLFDHLASPVLVEFYRRRKYDERLLKELNQILLQLNKVLNDAQEKQITHPGVKLWLDDLKDALYDADDLLDEIAIKALQCNVEADYQSPAQVVKFLISAVAGLFDRGVESKLEEIIKKLDGLVKEKDELGLTEDIVRRTTPLMESYVFGRENEREQLMKLLLSAGKGSHRIGVIPIVGMAGVGKTALAQHVYNDGDVNLHFEMKAWVCVSEVFDVLRMTTEIVELFTGSALEAKDLYSLQVKLTNLLRGKRFLIVLDDVWNGEYADWETLMSPLRFGEHGSMIIVTTRNENIASTVGTIPFNGLSPLSEVECWYLFSQNAFDYRDWSSNPHLEEVGMQIAKKCGGLPLAAKILGSLVRSQQKFKDWTNVLESVMWELENEKSGIFPELILSYRDLPSHLKRCFACFSLYPKDYEFNMKEVVSFWIAEGIVEKPKNNKTVEEEGDHCFYELLSRSFFQKSNANNDQFFVMHNLVRDLAIWVTGDFCYRLEDGMLNGTFSEKVRHFSYVRGKFDGFDKLKVIKDAKRLRTFLPLGRTTYGKQWLSKMVLNEILSRLTRLRFLSLPRYQIVELPDTIGNLIHLRFLDLSDTLISELPPSVCTFYKLETLLLYNCHLLTTLPTKLVNLILLRRLDISGTNLKEMPVQMSRLKDLQELTVFVVGRCNGSGINELKDLHLHGPISISNLQNVKGGSDALEAKLREKHLDKVELKWGGATDDSPNEILENLEPHTNLKHLKVINYGGTRFPVWLGDQSFSNMLSICLENCELCSCLPPLGQLPSLRELTIARMPGITTVGMEFYGESGSSISKPFQSLTTLRFEEMSEWVNWCILDAGAFPVLQELEVIRCPRLTRDLPNGHSLVNLKIKECPELVASSLPRTIMESQGLRILEISRCASNFPSKLLTPSVEQEFSCFKLLDGLSFSRCKSLESLQLGLFPKLRSLKVFSCGNFENLLLPNEIQPPNLPLLDKLYIEFCNKMVSFPSGGLPAPKLSVIRVSYCKNLKALPEQMCTLLPSLRRLSVRKCPEIESFPEGGLPPKLRSLSIWCCNKLIASRRGWGLQTLPYLTTLTLEGDSEGAVESFPEEGLLPYSLTTLEIEGLKSLKSLSNRGLAFLDSLEALKIRNCPQLKYLPDGGLPATLSELLIGNCPLLKPRCLREKGEDWYKIAHIPGIVIDGEAIFDHKYPGSPESAGPSASFFSDVTSKLE